MNDLSDKNFLLFAAKNYDNPQCENEEEFYDDLQITTHLKKLFARYHSNKELKERLIINHLICFFNVFVGISAVQILFFKLDSEYHSYLKTFLVYLDRCPERIRINSTIMELKNIPNDLTILHKLRQGYKNANS